MSGEDHNGDTGVGVEVRHEESGAVVCRLSGDLDLDSLAGPRAALEEALRTRVPLLVVDLAEVGFCDSSGLNMLLQIRLAAQESGTALQLGPVSAPVGRLLEITGASQVFTLRAPDQGPVAG